MNKAKMNYWVDVGIGVAGLISAVSGLVFLLPGDPTMGILGISYQTWNALHTWSSLGAIAGVGTHMALHWKWMVAMTKQIFAPTERRQAGGHIPEIAPGNATRSSLSRRSFLVLGGAATVVAGAVVAGYKVITAGTAEASQSEDQIAAVQQQEEGVACPFGLVNDPYPGRCKHYKDSNGDGICDYSVIGSGNNSAGGEDGRLAESFSRHRSGSGRP